MFSFGKLLLMIGATLLLATWAVSPLPMFPPEIHKFQATWPNPARVRYDDNGRRVQSNYSHWPKQSAAGVGATGGIWR